MKVMKRLMGIAAYGVDEVVASDGKRVTIATSLPDGQGWVGHLDACADGGSPSMDAVEAVGVHVVWKAGGASDAGDYHIALLLIAQSLANLGKGSGEGCEHRVISASRTPACELVALEILCCKYCHSARDYSLWPGRARR